MYAKLVLVITASIYALQSGVLSTQMGFSSDNVTGRLFTLTDLQFIAVNNNSVDMEMTSKKKSSKYSNSYK
ncbi:hypothetical protein NP570_25400, partial [Vibrio parahaemolyticus]|nr:hypothetical protein [Vibrio parahaemolyticus]